MSQSDDYAAGVYVRERDGKSRRVETRADAVAAVFEGFRRDGDSEGSDEQAKAEADQVEATDETDETPEGDVNGVGTLGTGAADEATPGPSYSF